MIDANLNTGDRNTGHWNTGNCNTGFFCVNTPPLTFFDQPTSLTWDEAYDLIPYVELPVGAEWITEADMTEEQKAQFPSYSTTGGCLVARTKPIREVFPAAWAKMNESEKQRWLDLPNFDAEKFLQITGVDVREPTTHTIVIDGRNVEISEESYRNLKAALDG